MCRNNPALARVLTGLLLAAPACPALAAWPYHPLTNLPVCTAPGTQENPAAIADGVDGAIVVWHDFRNVDNGADIYVQHVLASGAVDPAWPADGRALCTATSPQVAAAIASDGAGGAIITWRDYRGGFPDIYAQHVLASGAVDPAWPADGRALCTAAGSQEYPKIVADGAGGAIITWRDDRGVDADIYAQHVLASGAVDPAWPADGRALCTAAGTQQSPAILGDGAGGAIVTWNDYRSGNAGIYAQHVLSSGAVDPAWPAEGRALCAAVNSQGPSAIASDGAGGAIVTWNDLRTGGTNWDIYAQHVLASGAVDPGWPVDGRALCTAANTQYSAAIVSDGADGAIVTWHDYRSGIDYDIYAQHLLAGGVVDPTWPADGRAVSTAAQSQQYPRIVADGAGGAIMTWDDYRSGGVDSYAQHLLASGMLDPAWPADGRALSTASGNQGNPTIVSDGMDGAIVMWCDTRGGWGDIFAQRVAPFGRLGNPEAAIISVADYPGDQGGKVRIEWTRSYLDTLPTLEISAYGIWRQVPEAAVLAAERRGTRLLAGEASAADARPGVYRRTVGHAQAFYWEGVGSVLARGTSSYTFVATTFEDSTGVANPHTVFMVDAHAAFAPGFWDSRADSGYSVDNLAPAMPAPFTGHYAAGTTHLHWGPNPEPDLAGYRLYRGATPGFVPGPGNLVIAQADTGYADAADAPAYYKLAAADVHGNDSPYALLSPEGTVDVGGTEATRELSLAPPSPNPATRTTTVRYTLPRAVEVRLAIHDALGREVRVLERGMRPAGQHALAWDLRDRTGRPLGAGIYFVQLEVERRVLVQRLVAMR
ncbi:MAG TPA: FlgD immunoglobulin-like domain containing protein [Candidatus Eisenbacteria bacterium]|nr:FlgD immunoglobulin-like domain containing protein [Candidatus Eisenbacteria bacterium]